MPRLRDVGVKRAQGRQRRVARWRQRAQELALEQLAHPVGLREIVAAETGDEVAPVRLVQQQAFLLERAHRSRSETPSRAATSSWRSCSPGTSAPEAISSRSASVAWRVRSSARSAGNVAENCMQNGYSLRPDGRNPPRRPAQRSPPLPRRQRAAGAFAPRCDAWQRGFSPSFSRALAARGWVGMTLPRQYGGGRPIAARAFSGTAWSELDLVSLKLVPVRQLAAAASSAVGPSRLSEIDPPIF